MWIRILSSDIRARCSLAVAPSGSNMGALLDSRAHLAPDPGPEYPFFRATSSDGKESPCNAGDAGVPGLIDPLVWKIPWRRKWQPTPVFLPGESHGQRSLAGYSPWRSKELDTTERRALSLSAELRPDQRSCWWECSKYRFPLRLKV